MKHVLLAGLLLLAQAAGAQQAILVQRGGPYAPLPGPQPGSTLISTKKTLYYSPTGAPPYAPPTAAEYPASGKGIDFLDRYYWYDILPSGRLISRDAQGKNLVLTERGGLHPQPLAPFPRFSSPGVPYDIPYFHFVSETQGLLYYYNSMQVYQTGNQGRSWSYVSCLAPLIAPYRGYIRHFHMLTPQLGFAVVQVHENGEDADAGANTFRDSQLVRTLNGGLSWQLVRMPDEFTRNAILGTPSYLLREGKVYLLIYGDNRLYVSADQGASFSSHPVPNMQRLIRAHRPTGQQLSIDSKTYAPFKLIFFEL